MKKIFCIISAVMIGIIGSFLTTLCFIKTRAVKFDNPFSINVYYKNTTPIDSEKPTYYENDDEYSEIIDSLEKMVNSSLITLMFYNGNLENKTLYGGNDYASYDTKMKNDNLVVEFIYKETKNVVCYENGNSRVISFSCMIMIIPIVEKYMPIVVYTAVNNDSKMKEEEYKKSTPFVIKGNPKSLLKFADSF